MSNPLAFGATSRPFDLTQRVPRRYQDILGCADLVIGHVPLRSRDSIIATE
jgi:hypothetical protein